MTKPKGSKKTTPPKKPLAHKWTDGILPFTKILVVAIVALFVIWVIVKPYVEKIILLSTLEDLKGYGTYCGVIFGSWITGYFWPNISFLPRNK